jgi:hypothetical protein
MSPRQRSDRAGAKERGGAADGGGAAERSPARGERAGPGPRSQLRALGLLPQLALLALAFGLGVGVAELAGAVNLGTAFGIGQIVFAITLLFLLLRA